MVEYSVSSERLCLSTMLFLHPFVLLTFWRCKVISIQLSSSECVDTGRHHFTNFSKGTFHRSSSSTDLEPESYLEPVLSVSTIKALLEETWFYSGPKSLLVPPTRSLILFKSRDVLPWLCVWLFCKYLCTVLIPPLFYLVSSFKSIYMYPSIYPFSIPA